MGKFTFTAMEKLAKLDESFPDTLQGGSMRRMWQMRCRKIRMPGPFISPLQIITA